MYNESMEKTIPMCDDTARADIQMPLTERMVIATNMAGDALCMAESISEQLFGAVNREAPQNAPSKCFRDVLDNHNAQLVRLCEELSRMKSLLGM